MGTGIVANAAVLLPLDLPGLRALALSAWIAAVLLLARLVALGIGQWRRSRVWSLPSVTLANAPFWGAPPMALLTVASGTLLVGRDLLGDDAALAVAATMWTAGTIGGLIAAFAVP